MEYIYETVSEMLSFVGVNEHASLRKVSICVKGSTPNICHWRRKGKSGEGRREEWDRKVLGRREEEEGIRISAAQLGVDQYTNCTQKIWSAQMNMCHYRSLRQPVDTAAPAIVAMFAVVATLKCSMVQVLVPYFGTSINA